MRKQENEKGPEEGFCVRMTSVADFIPVWETVIGAEMFTKCLPEKGREITALVQFSNNHKLSYKIQHEDVQKMSKLLQVPCCHGWFLKTYFNSVREPKTTDS